MRKMIYVCILFIITSVLADDDSGIIFNTDDIMTKLNQKVNLECGIHGTYRHCNWEHKSEIFDVLDVHDDVYPGLNKPEIFDGNQCGIILNSASPEDHGEWTCKVFIKGETLIGSKNVTILVEPTQGEVTPATILAAADVETMIACTVMKARPAVQIRWLLGDEDITTSSDIQHAPVTPDGAFLSVSTLKRFFTPIDSEKELKCIVDHPALNESDIIIAPVIVHYAPIKSKPQTFYINETDTFEIKVNFSASPQPSKVLWQYGINLTEEIEIPLDDGHITTQLNTLDKEHFTAVLNISNLNNEDFNRQYNLFVENEIGSTTYEVRIEASVDNLKDEDHTVIIAVAITSSIVLTIVAVMTAICKCCTTNKDVIIACIPLCQQCYTSSKEDKPDKEKTINKPDEENGIDKPDGGRPIVINVIVKNKHTGEEDKTDELVGNIVKEVVDKVKINEINENGKNTDV